MRLVSRRLVPPKMLLIAMAVLYGVVSGGLGAIVIAADRADTLARIQAATRDGAFFLAHNADHALDAAELTLLRISELTMAGERSRLPQLLQASPFLANAYLLDRDGKVVEDGRNFYRTGTSFAGREWVRSLREDQAVVAIGPLSFDEASRTYVFVLGRRFGDGAIAAVAIDVEHFEQLHQALDIGPDLTLVIHTRDGALVMHQPFEARHVGGRVEEAVPVMREGAGATLRDGKGRVVSYRALAKHGLVVRVSISDEEAVAQWRRRSLQVGLFVAASLAVMGILGFFLIREWRRERRAVDELASLNHDLERSNADLEQFAYVASHDLKEPLRNIASYVQLLQRRYQGKLDPDADAFIGYTVDGVRRMQAIIQELLAYSRIGVGKLVMQQVQSGAAVSVALGQLKTVIGEAQAAVEVKGPLPVVKADPAQLASLFQNLIGNGVKYRRADARPEVTVGVEDRGTEWAFYVRDNGIGMESQYHQQIFELFKRLHPRDQYQGTGIGLSVCKRVVERLGGRIWVESQPGAGSTFWFTVSKIAP